MFPRFGVGGMVTLGGNDHRYNAFMSYTAAASLTKVRGAHTLKGGFEGRMLRVNVWEARSAGTFNFRTNETQGPNPNTASSTAGFGFASFLLGTGQPNDVLIQNWKNVAANSFYWAGYAQDDWRVNARLTLNLGLRYDIDVPRTERYDRMNYFDPDAPSPLAQQVPAFPDLRGGVVFVGVDGRSRYQYQLGHEQHRAAARPVVPAEREDRRARRLRPHLRAVESGRAGHGRPVRFPHREPLGHDASTASRRSTRCRIPYPNGFLPSPGASQGLLTQAGANLQAPLQDTPSPWTIQCNVNVQRELPWSMFVEVAYVGTRGYDLSTVGEGGLSLNQLDPQYMSLGAAAQSAGGESVLRHREQRRADAADGQPRAAAAAVPAVHRRHSAVRGGAKSRYNALQITGRKRLIARLDVRRLVHLREGRGDRHEPPGQLRPRRELGARVVRHQSPLRDQLSVRAARSDAAGGSSPALPPVVNALHRRLAVQRHHDAAGRHAAVDHGEQHRRHLRRENAAEQQRQRSAG